MAEAEYIIHGEQVKFKEFYIGDTRYGTNTILVKKVLKGSTIDEKFVDVTYELKKPTDRLHDVTNIIQSGTFIWLCKNSNIESGSGNLNLQLLTNDKNSILYYTLANINNKEVSAIANGDKVIFESKLKFDQFIHRANASN